MEDGVVFRHSATDFLLTAARPNLGYLEGLVGRLDVSIEDVSDAYGILAVQGPRSVHVLSELTDGDVRSLRFFQHLQAKIGTAPVTVSRTGYTGDLGFEITVAAEDALTVLDAVLDAGKNHGLRPFGEEALMMLRIEAGLPLIDVDFHSSRLAFTDHGRVTPKELGLGWMLKGLEDGRAFMGGQAIRHELANGTSRWATVGIVADWQDWDRLYRDAGLLPPKDEHPLPYESVLYDEHRDQVGYATSFMYSPVLQRHIGLARARPDMAKSGTPLGMELAINHQNTTVKATTCRLPHFNPARKIGDLR
jgi:aminomethyltransferase